MADPVSALCGARAAEAVIGIDDAGLRGQVTLKADLGAPQVAECVRELVGVEVPGIWRCNFDAGRGAVWMAPDELLLLVPYDDAGAAVSRASEVLSGRHHLALDVSDARAVVRLTGPLVGEVLAKGVPCDVSDRAFPPGLARRTHLGGIAVVFWRLEHDVWEIAAFRSFAHHLMVWLEQSALPGSEVGWT